MKLKTIEDTDRLNYRFPLSIKQELDELAERCKKEKLDFIAALSEGLRGVAKVIRQQLDGKRTRRGAKTGASVAPESFPNGGLK
jgi:hypothetical protein